jgi:hypothetical protein
MPVYNGWLDEPCARWMIMGRQKKYRGHDWRRHPRTPIHYPMHCQRLGNPDTGAALCINISEGGAMFVSRKPFEFGDLLDLQFAYSNSLEHESLSLNAVVVWSDTSESLKIAKNTEWCVGVEFVNLNFELPLQLYQMIEEFKSRKGKSHTEIN